MPSRSRSARVPGVLHAALPEPALDLIERYGRLPLPPYITHDPDAYDETRYQTVYARNPGAVAAPTAGLHFDDALFARLDAMGVRRAFLTLHVGAGTFQPVRSENRRAQDALGVVRGLAGAGRGGARDTCRRPPRDRRRHTCCARWNRPRARTARWCRQRRHRHLHHAGLPLPPGRRAHHHFHLPKSTLLMLVSALAGVQTIRAATATLSRSTTASSAMATPC